jgi:hypothetical protein
VLDFLGARYEIDTNPTAFQSRILLKRAKLFDQKPSPSDDSA